MPPNAGFRLKPGYLSLASQRRLVDDIAAIAHASPFYVPTMPRTGKPFSVAMTNCGSLGWVSDKGGYRYQPRHPESGDPWPLVPQALIKIWEDVSDYSHPPEACLVNYYRPGARMGLHADVDEADFSAPVVSISLGATALFRLGGDRRRDATHSFRLSSGDVVILGGASRKAYHGIDRIYDGTSRMLDAHGDLFPDGGRINLTLRRVTFP